MPTEVWESTLFGLFRLQAGERSAGRAWAPQTTLLFAYLATYPRPHPRDAIIGLFWPDADVESGRRRLSQALWRIRQDIEEEILVADRNTVGLDPQRVTSDVSRFRSLLKNGGAPAWEEAVDLFSAGEFLAGFYEEWVHQERLQLSALHLEGLARLIAHFEEAGRFDRALPFAEKAVAVDRLSEEANATYLRLLIADGRAAAAQRHYREFARLLAAELDLEPSPQTEALLRNVPSGPRTSPLRVSPLPASLNTFRGRQEELGELARVLLTPESPTRVATLLGTSGVGKTRLALEFARRLSEGQTEPVIAFVPLADLRDPAQVGEAIADAVSAVRDAPPLARIVGALLGSKPPFLLILDNAEHVTEQAGVLARELLASIPRLRILVTSQRPLGIAGEAEVVLAPLALPEAELSPENAPSVALFIDRARAVRPSFAESAAELEAVGKLCRRLEGLPLAIELCAAWAQTLSASQMLAMLDQRFDFLVSRRADIPVRHRTLRAAMEHSYLQLPEELRGHFVKFAVFEDGWSLEAATALDPRALTALAELQEHSLIVASPRRNGDGMRYRMLESLREFALEQRTVGQRRQHQAQHAAYYGEFVVTAIARLPGTEYAQWTARLEEEHGNIRQALSFLWGEPEAEPALVPTCAIAAHWSRHGRAREAREWLERALPRLEEAPLRARAQAETAYADALRRTSEYALATRHAEAALQIWQAVGDDRGAAEARMQVGSSAALSGDFERAQSSLTEALRLARGFTDERLLGEILNNLGGVAVAMQDWDAAWQVVSEALLLERKLGNGLLIAYCLSNLSLIARYRGDYAAARRLLDELMEHRTRHNFYWDAISTMHRAVIERLDGNYALSLSLMDEAFDEAKHGGETRVLAWCLKEQGHLAAAVGAHAVALRLLSRAESLRESLGISFKPFGEEEIGRDREAALGALGSTVADAEWTLGRVSELQPLLSLASEAIRERTSPHPVAGTKNF